LWGFPDVANALPHSEHAGSVGNPQPFVASVRVLSLCMSAVVVALQAPVVPLLVPTTPISSQRNNQGISPYVSKLGILLQFLWHWHLYAAPGVT